MLTISKLKSLFIYNPKTGLITRILRTSNCIKVGEVAGHLIWTKPTIDGSISAKPLEDKIE